ncbi:hypothetical protein DFJ77DRAFT_472735 [Powellomyces hirtus]|nr:hypothetical protein DFJ77DRAFT_472735 [Powellomyces hirtus]
MYFLLVLYFLPQMGVGNTMTKTFIDQVRTDQKSIHRHNRSQRHDRLVLGASTQTALSCYSASCYSNPGTRDQYAEHPV